MNVIEHGFGPEFDENSEILILGSFPSVKSREVSFYYGNKQNRFWKTMFEFFGEPFLESVEERKKFLHDHHVALWDVVTACTIVGSQDATLEAVAIANLNEIFAIAKIKAILLNGTKAYDLFIENFSDISIPSYKMSSTSPANPRFRKEKWFEVLSSVSDL